MYTETTQESGFSELQSDLLQSTKHLAGTRKRIQSTDTTYQSDFSEPHDELVESSRKRLCDWPPEHLKTTLTHNCELLYEQETEEIFTETNSLRPLHESKKGEVILQHNFYSFVQILDSKNVGSRSKWKVEKETGEQGYMLASHLIKLTHDLQVPKKPVSSAEKEAAQALRDNLVLPKSSILKTSSSFLKLCITVFS